MMMLSSSKRKPLPKGPHHHNFHQNDKTSNSLSKLCDKCDFNTNEINEFIEHMKLDHNLDEIYPCDLCSFYTESLWNYQVHMEKHSEKKQNKSYSSLSTSNATINSSNESTESPIKEEYEENNEDNHTRNDLIENKKLSNNKSIKKESNYYVDNEEDEIEKQINANDDENENENENNDVCSMDEEVQQVENLINDEEQDEENDDFSSVTNNINSKKLKLQHDRTGDEDENEDDQEDNEVDEDVNESIMMIKSNRFNNSAITNEKIKSKGNSVTSRDKMLFDIGAHQNFNNQFKNSSQYISSFNTNSKQNMQSTASTIVVTHPNNVVEKAKRHYNSEVDPARYRKVIEEGITKFACSICGNTYKWRKSLNKHWKEKHITETPPPLDAPVTVKLRNGTTTINCIATNGTTLTIPSSQNNQPQHIMKKSDSFINNINNNNNSFDKKPILKPNDINQKAINSTSTPINNKNALPIINNRSMNSSNLKQTSHSSSIISSNNNNANNLPTVVPPSNNVFAYLNALQQYMNNAAIANNISFNTPSNNNNNESKINKNHHSNGLNDFNNNNTKRQRKLDDSIERPLDLSMKNIIPNNHHRKRSSSYDSNNDDNNNNQQSSISLKNLENSIKRLKTLNNNNDSQSRYGKHESRKSLSNKQKSSSSSSSRNSSPNSSLSNSSSNIINNNNNSGRLTKDENNNQNNTLSNSKHNNSLNNLSSTSATAYNQKLFVCSICDSKFHVVDHINEHFLKNHYNEYQRELSSKSPPRNTNVAQQNEEWNLSDPANPLKCIKCDFVGRWPTELQKHAASHSTSRPFKCLICSLTYKWRWDLAKHFDRTHPTFRNPYKKRDRDAARSTLVPSDANTGSNADVIKSGKLVGQQNNNAIKKSNNNQRSRSRSADSNYDDSNRSQSPSSDLGSENSFKNNQNNLIDFSNKSNNRTKFSNNSNNNFNKSLQKLSKNINESIGLNSLPFDQFNPVVMSSLLANNNNNSNSNNALWAACLASLTNQSMLPPAAMPPPPTSIFQQYQKISNGLPSQEALLSAMNMDPNAASLMLHTLLSQQQQGLSNSNNQKNVNILSPLSNTSSSSQINNNHNNTFLINKLNNSIQSSCSTSSVASQQQSVNKKIKTNDISNMNSNNINNSLDKESRNFSCYWCDFKGRWRSEIIQHMRCHHAREKPYRCSACMYASNWKWDVQKHTKKQHPNNINAKIVEIPDQILFPDIKDFNFFDSAPTATPAAPSTSKSTSPSSSTASSYSSSTTKSLPNLTPPSSNHSISSSTSSNKLKQNNGSTINKNVKSSLCCQQCPYVACNLSDLRRHLIVHSNEQPYHCCSCDFKSKWKSDVKKHQRTMGHVGPILVGKKAMQKVIENLGLDRTSIVNLYGPNIQVIDNKQCKSNEKLIDEDNLEFKINQRIIDNKKRKRCDDSSDNYNDYEDQEEFIEDEEEEDEYEQLNEEDDDEVEIDEDYEDNYQNNNNNQEDDEMINNNEDEENNLNMIDDEEDCNNLEIENDDEEL